MALVTCAECGAQMSDKAAACPKCGAPNPAIPPPVPTTVVVQQPAQQKQYGCASVLLGLLGLIFLAGMIRACNQMSTPASVAPSASAPAAPASPPKTAAQLLASAQEHSNSGRTTAATADLQQLLRQHPSSPEAGAAKALLEKVSAQVEAQRVARLWQYLVSEDAMAGKPIKQALIRSKNKFAFDFPYAGAQNGTLILRKHPRYGSDVILTIERGQFQCSFDGCSVMVRFDSRPAMRFSASEPESNDTTTLFIEGYNRFLGELRRSKTVAIEAKFFQQAPVVMEFEVGGLDPSKL